MIGTEAALRRCAASLNLDPDYVGSSVASQVWRRLGHLQSRNALKFIHCENPKNINRPSKGESK